jgi:hypothetical protein
MEQAWAAEDRDVDEFPDTGSLGHPEQGSLVPMTA